MPIHTHAEFSLGDLLVRYVVPSDRSGPPGLLLVPRRCVERMVVPREQLSSPAVSALPSRWQPIRAWEVDPLGHVAIAGRPAPAGFAHGRTLRGSAATQALRLVEQHVVRTGAATAIRTQLADGAGLELCHELDHDGVQRALKIQTTVRNAGVTPLTLGLITSFSLDGLTPFAADDAPGRLRVHRFRSAWSGEGRHLDESVERLHLERTWTGHGVNCERFGAVGSMPVQGWFPFVAVEDRAARVWWAANLAHPGTWQMEIYRRADQLAISGGLGDREFGHWAKTLQPGESLTAPAAWITASAESLDDACDRLREPLRASWARQPVREASLPVVFNEWCTSWGNPTHDSLVALADRLRNSGVTYLVIDDGWAERPPGALFQSNGDWNVCRLAFPRGLRATAEAIRARGLIPGIWFEPEVVNPGSAAWNETTHHLHRDGVPLQVGNRRFWDFRDPWVHAWLDERVIRLLRENEFGYLKIDYNDTLGPGCDGAESPGEGLRQHLAGVRRFLQRLRDELPDLVIENCASGGHRLEPSLLALTALSSCSDAHETPDAPIVAANVLRLVPAAQNQIWAVLRAGDSLPRLAYTLAATFLGRMCLSGEVHALDAAQWEIARRAIALHRELAPVIARGTFRRFGRRGESYQHPTGAQAVRCVAADGRRAFVVWHAFAEPPAEVAIPLPEGAWRITEEFPSGTGEVRIREATLVFPRLQAWTGGVVVLQAAAPRFPQ